MKMYPVNSSNIEAIGFDEDTHTLAVLFHNQNTYTYSPVTYETYEEMLTAESVGQYFTQNIKNNPEIICIPM